MFTVLEFQYLVSKHSRHYLVQQNMYINFRKNYRVHAFHLVCLFFVIAKLFLPSDFLSKNPLDSEHAFMWRK
jgi:hypothetical protein